MKGERNPGHFKDCGKFSQVPVLLSTVLYLAWRDAISSMGRQGQSTAQSTLRLKDTGGQGRASASASVRGRLGLAAEIRGEKC